MRSDDAFKDPHAPGTIALAAAAAAAAGETPARLWNPPIIHLLFSFLDRLPSIKDIKDGAEGFIPPLD